jgi:predicted transcriptional regulator
MIRIGIITISSSLHWIKAVEQFLGDHCEITYITYEKQNEILNIYLENYSFFDGVIFSGEFPYLAVKKGLSTPFPKPAVYFDLTERDFYKTLCKAMIDHKITSFSRTMIDFLFEQNQYLGLKDLVDEKDFPYIYSKDLEGFELETIHEDLLNRHVKLWGEGKIDLSITRATSLSKKLSEYNIKHIILYPSTDSMEEKWSVLLKEIELHRLVENQMAIGILTIKHHGKPNDMDMDLEFKQILLNKALLEFNKKHQLSFMIKRNMLNIEVITSFKELKSITNHFTSCLLLQFLKENLPFHVGIGWGVGYTLHEAQMNAVQANKESMMDKNDSNVYIMTENEHLIGPLGEEKCIEISNESNPKIENLSQQIEVSSLQIQKLLAVMEKLGTNEVMSDDISQTLGITIRAANRILHKLEEKGVAEVIVKKQKKLKGRPKKLYRIDFHKYLSI